MPQDFEYRPKIAYPLKEAIPVEPSQEVVTTPTRPYVAPIVRPLVEELLEAMGTIDRAILAAEERLANRTVAIDPEQESGVSEAIRHFCVLNSNPDGVVYNDSTINISIVRRACIAGDDPRAGLILDKWFAAMQEEDGDVAGELYEQLWRLKNRLAESIGLAGSYIAPVLTGSELSVGEYGKVDAAALDAVDELEQVVLAHRRKLELDIEAAYRSDDIPSDLVETQAALVNLDLGRKTVYHVTEALRDEAATTQRIGGRALFIIQSGTYEALGDSACCFLKKILNGLDTSSLDALNRGIDQAISFLRGARGLLRLRFDKHVLDLANIRDLLSSVKSIVINMVVNAVASVMQQTIIKLASPVVGRLERLVEAAPDAQETCIPLETIGNVIMDAVDYVLEEYMQSVMDRIRSSKKLFDGLDGFLGECEDKQRSRNIMKLFDDLADALESLRDRLDIKENMVSFIEDFVRQHGFDTVFDSAAQTRGRLDAICS